MVSGFEGSTGQGCGRRYFLNQEKAMQYYEKSKEGDPHVNWDWDEIETED